MPRACVVGVHRLSVWETVVKRHFGLRAGEHARSGCRRADDASQTGGRDQGFHGRAFGQVDGPPRVDCVARGREARTADHRNGTERSRRCAAQPRREHRHFIRRWRTDFSRVRLDRAFRATFDRRTHEGQHRRRARQACRTPEGPLRGNPDGGLRHRPRARRIGTDPRASGPLDPADLREGIHQVERGRNAGCLYVSSRSDAAHRRVRF